MNFDSNKQLIESAKKHNVSPSNVAWQRLENKLSNKKNEVKLKLYRNISIAATLIAIFSVLTVFNYSITSNKISNDIFGMDMLPLDEITNIEGENIYDLDKIASLRLAYKKLGMKQNM